MGGVFKRLIIKLLVFEPIALTLAAISILKHDSSITDLAIQLLKSIIFIPYGALWYVNALIVAILFLIPIIKRGKEEIAIMASLVLYLAFLLFNRYYFLVEGTKLGTIVDQTLDAIGSMRNGLFVGLLFVTAGLLLAKYQRKLQFYCRYFVIATVVSLLLLVLEVWLIFDCKGIDDSAFFISYVIFIPSLFATTILLPNPGIKCATTLRNLSTSIYFMHHSLLKIVSLISVNVIGCHLTPFYAYLITLALIFTVCWIVYRGKYQPFYDWIR